MNLGTQLMVGATFLALGGITLWIAATQAEQDVRYVEQLLADPDAHREGAYTLMGIPQPATIPVTTPQGTQLQANPDHEGTVRSVTTWMHEGLAVFSIHELSVSEREDGRLEWTFRNTTKRTPADPSPLWAPVQSTWIFGQSGEAYPVVAFTQDGKRHPDTPRIWAYQGKAPENPVQPKPSQFVGRLMTHLPDGTPLPDGAHIFDVREYTAGCSSKFLPPESREAYASQSL
jgi:hypothetical protein